MTLYSSVLLVSTFLARERAQRARKDQRVLARLAGMNLKGDEEGDEVEGHPSSRTRFAPGCRSSPSWLVAPSSPPSPAQTSSPSRSSATPSTQGLDLPVESFPDRATVHDGGCCGPVDRILHVPAPSAVVRLDLLVICAGHRSPVAGGGALYGLRTLAGALSTGVAGRTSLEFDHEWSCS
jgi:hypothetical protein